MVVSSFRDSSIHPALCILYQFSIGVPSSSSSSGSSDQLASTKYQLEEVKYKGRKSETSKKGGMQSKLAEATMRSGGLVSAFTSNRVSQWIRAASQTPNPSIHSGDPEGIDADEAAKAAANEREQQQRELEEKSSKVHEKNTPFSSGKLPPSQPKFESTVVGPPPDPIFQQKRRSHAISLEDFICVGVDGRPLNSKMGGDELVEQQYEEQDEQANYYKDHKPSPLSEVEFVDTRKPITRATDGTADADDFGRDADCVIGWKEEQLDTAEEALERAVRIWKESAMRGDPDSPQSKALRAMLGELN